MTTPKISLLRLHQERAAALALAMLMLRMNAGLPTVPSPHQLPLTTEELK